MIFKACCVILVVCIAQVSCGSWNSWALRSTSNADNSGSVVEFEQDPRLLNCLKAIKEVRERINCIDQQGLIDCISSNQKLTSYLAELNKVQRNLATSFSHAIAEFHAVPKKTNIVDACNGNIADANKVVDDFTEKVGTLSTERKTNEDCMQNLVFEYGNCMIADQKLKNA